MKLNLITGKPTIRVKRSATPSNTPPRNFKLVVDGAMYCNILQPVMKYGTMVCQVFNTRIQSLLFWGGKNQFQHLG